MIAEKRIAKRIETLMRDLSRQLDESIRLVQETRPDNEFREYRRSAGFIMGRIFTDIMTPIYRSYPDLVPAGLRIGRPKPRKNH